MAFPVVESLTPTVISTAATSHPVAMPATVNLGELLIVEFANFGADTVALPANWNPLATTVSTFRASLYYKIADGTEGGTTVDFVTGTTKKAAAHTYRISAWHGTTPPEAGTPTTGTSVSPDPPALTPSWGAVDTLWLSLLVASGAQTVSAYPLNYTDGADDSTTAGSAVTVASARRNLNAASEDPGVFTIPSAAWVANTLAIRPSGAAQTLTGTLFQSAPTFPVGTLSHVIVPPPSTGGNRMGGSGAIRKPPRHVGR